MNAMRNLNQIRESYLKNEEVGCFVFKSLIFALGMYLILLCCYKILNE
jgi:DMSO reductase anchor subunit